MKRYMKKSLAISLAAMLIFETIPVSTLPLHFKSYAKTDEK